MTSFHVFSWTRILQGFNRLPRTSQPAPKRRFLLKHFSTFSNWMLVHYNAWSSTSWALFPRRRWPPAARCLWSPALVRLTKTRRTTSPQKAFESLAFKSPPQTFRRKPCQILVSLFPLCRHLCQPLENKPFSIASVYIFAQEIFFKLSHVALNIQMKKAELCFCPKLPKPLNRSFCVFSWTASRCVLHHSRPGAGL